MKLLVDSSFPKRLHQLPNRHGVDVDRYDGSAPDRDLVRYAAEAGYDALLVLDQELVTRPAIRELAEEVGVTLVCSVTDDPVDAETYLRSSLSTLAERVRRWRGGLLWLRKAGVSP